MSKHWYRKPRYIPQAKCPKCGNAMESLIDGLAATCDNPNCGSTAIRWRQFQKGKREAISGNLCASVWQDGRIYRWRLVSLLDTSIALSAGWESDEETAKQTAERALITRSSLAKGVANAVT